MTDRRQTPDRRQHGTRRRYQQGCSCRDCRRANAAAVASWRQNGRADPWIDAGAVQGHLIEIEAQDIGTRQVAKQTGLSRSVLQAIRAGARHRIRQSDALLVLSIEIEPAAYTLTSPWQVKRTIRALLSEDYTKRRLAQLLGLRWSRLPRHTDGTQTGRVRRSTQLRLAQLYDTLTAEG